jgi:predicted HTH domain antitoxin
MPTVTIDYPPELPAALGKRPNDAVGEVQFMGALKLFESGRISSGLAAKLAGVTRVEFLLQCGRYGISVFQQTPDELDRDAKVALDARCR